MGCLPSGPGPILGPDTIDKVGSAMGKHVRFTDDGVVLSRTGLSRVVYTLAAIGMVLGVLGLHAGYARLGADTREGHIVTVAIVVAAVSVAGCVAFARWSHRRAVNGR